MGRRRLGGVLAGLVALLVVVVPAVAAGTAAPTLKAQYAPLNKEIKQEGNDIGAALQNAKNQTDVQLAKVFSGLAQRAAASAVKVSRMRGARGANLITQRQLALALSKGASDLSRIAVTANAHNAKGANAATKALIADSAPITAGRTRLAKSLGIA